MLPGAPTRGLVSGVAAEALGGCSRMSDHRLAVTRRSARPLKERFDASLTVPASTNIVALKADRSKSRPWTEWRRRSLERVRSGRDATCFAGTRRGGVCGIGSLPAGRPSSRGAGLVAADRGIGVVVEADVDKADPSGRSLSLLRRCPVRRQAGPGRYAGATRRPSVDGGACRSRGVRVHDDLAALTAECQRPVAARVDEIDECGQRLPIQLPHQARGRGHGIDHWQRLRGGSRCDRGTCRPSAARCRHFPALEVMPTVWASAKRALLAASPMTRHRDTPADWAWGCGHRTCLLELTVPRLGQTTTSFPDLYPSAQSSVTEPGSWRPNFGGKFPL